MDEAGRGAWAGPVAAAAVVLPPVAYCDRRLLRGVADSKRLTPSERRRWEIRIRHLAIAVGVAFASPRAIDRDGIVGASRLAMLRALDRLPVRPDHVIVDALPFPHDCAYGPIHTALVKADARCLAVAAASICAKVARDRLMQRLDRAFSGYGFARHKGYGTAEHRTALQALGPSPLHRRSFRPVRECGPRALAALAG